MASNYFSFPIDKNHYFEYYKKMNKVLLPENLAGFKIYMIGIKGTGMTAIAEVFASKGAIVEGSDVPEDFYTAIALKKLKVRVNSPFSAGNINNDIQLVVFSAAYSVDTNEELAMAKNIGLPMISYPEALGLLSKQFYSVGICGVHGKTSTTGIVGTVVKQLNLPATVLAGSVISNFNNSCVMNSGSKYFIAETCEYKKHFLNFSPKKIILTSIESDHQDYFPTYSSILAAFLQYINTLPQFSELIYCADDEGACEAANLSFSSRPDMIFIPYGEKASGDYKIKIKGMRDEKLYFTLSSIAGEFSLQVPGHHNVLNATAAIALAISLIKKERGSVSIKDISMIRKGIATYKGASRRTELIGTIKNKDILIFDDYAHHPTAIKSLLKGLKEFYPNRRIIADFMSHTYTRTEALLEEFASCFGDANVVILHKIFSSAREKYSGQVDAELLFNKTKKHHKNVFFFNEVLDAKDFVVSKLKEGDLFITIGAGENYLLSKEVFKFYKGQDF